MRQALLHRKLLLHRMSKFIMLLLQDEAISIEWLIKTI